MTLAESLRALLACGVFAAVLPTGLWLLQCAGEGSRAAARSLRWAMAIPLGIALWSLPLSGAAQLGLFDPAVVGVAGWSSVLVLARRSIHHLPRPAVSWERIGTTAALSALAWLFAAFPNEALLGNRDEGLYSLTALLLLRTGGTAIEAPAAAAIAPAMFHPFSHGQPVPFFLPGIYQDPDGLQLQFPPLLPAWIAQVSAATLGGGLFRTSALFSLAAVFTFLALARRWLRPAVALLATTVFALNPAQVWISRVNLVEPLATMLVLGGLLAATIALERRSVRLAALAGAMFAVAAFGRLDLVLLSPLLAGTLVLMRVWPSPRFEAAANAAAALAASTVAAQAVALAALAVVSPGYLRTHAVPVLVAGAATLGLLSLLPLCHARLLEPLRSAAARRTLAIAAALALAALFAYAAALRPGMEPFALIDRPGHALDGARDFRERTLPALAAYLGWSTVVAALLGAAIATARVLSGAAHPALPMLLLVGVASSIVMLANPRISPDHFWAVRRFVPLVIPCTALLAAYGAQALLVRIFREHRGIVAGALAASAAAMLVWAQWPTLFLRENHGLAAQFAALDRLLDGASLVLVRDADAVAGTLLLGFGRPVLPLRDYSAPVNAEARRLWSVCTAASPCALLHGDHRGLAGLAVGAARRALLERRYIEPTPRPLARTEAAETIDLLVSRVEGLAAADASRSAGAHRDWNVDDAGFHREDLLESSSGRWTNGDAMIRLPALVADTIEVGFMVPGDGPRPVRISLDGQVLHDGPLAGAQRMRFALPSTGAVAQSRELRLRSATFNPRAAGGASDGRDLGVWVFAVRQLVSATPRLLHSSGGSAYRSRVTAAGWPPPSVLEVDATVAPPRVTMTVENRGDSVWPVGTDVKDGEVPVELGIVWRPRSGGASLHEQRAALPFALHPGERVLMTPPIDPRRADGSALPPGDYDVEVDLLQEHVGWFASRGGAAAHLAVTVTAGRPR